MQRPERGFLELVVNVNVERLPCHLVLGKVKTVPVVDQGKRRQSRCWMLHQMAARGAAYCCYLSLGGGAGCDRGRGGSWS